MRQTFADEIVNAGWDHFKDDTVIFKTSLHNLNTFKDYMSLDKKILPPFDRCFVEWDTHQGFINGIYVENDSDNYKCDDGEQFFIVVVFVLFTLSNMAHIAYHPRPVGYLLDNGIFKDVIPVEEVMFPNFQRIPPHDKYGDVHNEAINSAFYTFACLHDKADVELVTPSRQVSRQIERKTGKKPSPYFEIVVNPNKAQKRYTSTSKSGRKHNAHVVRGHFATYDDSAPLFGKYTGTFWRPSHVRGSGDQHVKPKDYRIVLPNNNQSA